ncbi:MAG: Panacea domain-containing protein [Polyangiaceae bacterium]
MSNKKLEEAIVYVARCCIGEQLFGAIKLNKILFFADAHSYVRYGATITGADYEKREFGPVPVRMPEVIADLTKASAVQIYERTMPDTAVQKRVTPLRDPDMTVFTARDVEVLSDVIRWISPMTAREVSELSHESVGWESARMGDVIPRSTALVRRGAGALSEAEFGHALSLARRVAQEGLSVAS